MIILKHFTKYCVYVQINDIDLKAITLKKSIIYLMN